MKYISLALLGWASLLSMSSQALQLSSPDIAEGKKMDAKFEYQGFGCNGGNQSPQLNWRDVPEGTKSFALTVYDPDAPTGSGWWHWIAIDIPASTRQLAAGVDIKKLGGLELNNDYGSASFGGACPPKGHGMHRYVFTLWALPTESLKLDVNASQAVAGYKLNASALAKAKLTATYVRE
ncbi:YbhB/YbcL family Raf kinase inhibitor-like protein [Agarivorans sp. QJM3NY_25]|uniref:YbhB/YbcL family Raf kinase inhibitor-like protein n=1 Tax=Agarivorans sp. QJM3NY_25 TaxID=3421430 RepID=UPI003D7D12C4